MDQSIRGYLANLEQQGELVRFQKEVDPLENLTAIGWKTYDRLGKGSLFDNLKGFPEWKVCNQILIDRRKWGIGLGVSEQEVIETFNTRVKSPIDTVMVDAAQAPIKEVILKDEDVDLTKIPAAWTSELDPGPFIASGMAIIKDPDTGIRNMSIHRQQIMGKNRTGYLICPRQALRIYQKYQERNEAMPVAMVVGAHPAIYFSSSYTAPYGVDELTVAGALMGEPVRMVKCETIDIEVPAEAEMILEGEIPPDAHTPEGPFGEGSGGYAMEGFTQYLDVKCISRRENPVFYAMQCGAPMTDTQALVATAIDMLLWEHLKNVEGGLDLLDLRCLGLAGMMAVVIKLRPRVEGQAKTALLAALSGPQMHPKLAIAVDEDIDASDMRQVFWSLTTRVHAERDVIKIPNARTWSLDNVSDIVPGQSAMHRIGTKTLVDATKPAATDPDGRERFAMAMPKNYDSVELKDFLPD
ncbi:MAG: Phenolic acid decarboxylase subunit C [Alphaproteobacteria bacterium MarineAlpha11_Bin1]|nr:MAG: Phenolic acid decarboxylase subunit C [Alphaproteobacteria bacterium MarineAlpha11_Bin1]|tara:strand:+ start:9095 stop:10498 length:1404 start_codon:yes stop_codon:yes gene_type:complete